MHAIPVHATRCSRSHSSSAEAH